MKLHLYPVAEKEALQSVKEGGKHALEQKRSWERAKSLLQYYEQEIMRTLTKTLATGTERKH